MPQQQPQQQQHHQLTSNQLRQQSSRRAASPIRQTTRQQQQRQETRQPRSPAGALVGLQLRVVAPLEGLAGLEPPLAGLEALAVGVALAAWQQQQRVS
jgi:hypothetical protein